ncbi:hypothetical protein NIES4071_68720 [Calothrix sp. NIES-4071]|nr:hypothetical protein NIES4071_68720 [Calothrix sp. NIES-4071]BAZ61150.1 hypothetical protein NIES4105_68680 [Calothrix sp. NIES-4105]
MTTNEELTSIFMKNDVTTTNDEIDQQLTALRELLKLSPFIASSHFSTTRC